MVPLRVRRATAADAPAITGLVNRAYVVERFFIDGDRTTLQEVSGMMARGLFLVGEIDGTPVAVVYVEVRGGRGYFGLLSVEPSRQGQGLGRLLVDEAEAYCRAAGCQAMDIHVVDLRSELPPFYRRLGYNEVGSQPFPDADKAKLPCRFIVMSKPLA
jgi:GNAT superfamily N-acetyltransferase